MHTHTHTYWHTYTQAQQEYRYVTICVIHTDKTYKCVQCYAIYKSLMSKFWMFYIRCVRIALRCVYYKCTIFWLFWDCMICVTSFLPTFILGYPHPSYISIYAVRHYVTHRTRQKKVFGRTATPHYVLHSKQSIPIASQIPRYFN